MLYTKHHFDHGLLCPGHALATSGPPTSSGSVVGVVVRRGGATASTYPPSVSGCCPLKGKSSACRLSRRQDRVGCFCTCWTLFRKNMYRDLDATANDEPISEIETPKEETISHTPESPTCNSAALKKTSQVPGRLMPRGPSNIEACKGKRSRVPTCFGRYGSACPQHARRQACLLRVWSHPRKEIHPAPR